MKLILVTAFFVISFVSQVSFALELDWVGCGISKKAFMQKASEEYYKKYGVKINLTGGGASKGIRRVHSGKSHLGGSCRNMLHNGYPSLESETNAVVVAWDIIVPIVNKKNPIDSITDNEIYQVLTGKISNWQKLGSNKFEKINLLVRKGTVSGVGWSVRQMFFASNETMLVNKESKVHFTDNAKVMRSSGPIEKQVETDTTAFALTGISSARKRELKILKMNGVEPTLQNIVSGKISTFRPLFLVFHKKNDIDIQKFIAWILSDEGQKIIENEGTISVNQGKKAKLRNKYKHWEDTKLIVNFENI